MRNMPSNSRLLNAAGFAALSIIIGYTLQKNEKLISDMSRVGRLVKDEEDEYDVIVIGGGTAGCVLASRLSEDPSIRVLLIEAGGSGKALALSRIPTAFSMLFHTRHVYQFYTEPQPNAGGTKKFWPRGKLLGGCSSINAQMAQYGSPTDFDEWAKIIGDDSWSFKNFGKYFRKFESYAPNAKFPLVNASARGAIGPVNVGYNNTVSKTAENFIQACTKVGIPFSADFTGMGGTIGVNRIMTYVDSKARRVSSETAYLTDSVLARPNLKVLINSQVTRILFDKVGSETRAVGVEFTQRENGPRFRARARKEVVLSAGAIHSPQILMLSGVGPEEHLAEHKIPLIHSLPGVGNHLLDHPVVDMYFRDKTNTSPKFLQPKGISDLGKVLVAAAQYFISGTGPLANNVGEAAAFIRSDDPVLFPPSESLEKLEDSTSGANSPDLEIFTTPLAYKDHGLTAFDVYTYSIHVCLLRPMSVGSLRLKSRSPWAYPILDPRYCENEQDVKKLARGVKAILKIAQTEPLASLLDHAEKRPDLDHFSHLKNDQEIEQLVRERLQTLYHPTSTCRMAPLEEGGVVDSDQKVYGIKGLRVCDASIFPKLVSGHTAGATLAIGERLADVMKKEHAAARWY